MQNRYAGDIGDYLKLALLRALAPGYRLGLAWWLVPDEGHNSDGRHTSYLDDGVKWRNIDSPLFDMLQSMVMENRRSVHDLEMLIGVPDCRFSSALIPMPKRFIDRPAERYDWFKATLSDMSDCDLIFVDPDNGLEPDRHRPQSSKSNKAITYAELRALAENERSIIAYHHQTRRKGGHLAEVEFLADRLRAKGFRRVDAIRARPYSPRIFFLLNFPESLARSAAEFVARHSTVFSWHPDKVDL